MADLDQVEDLRQEISTNLSRRRLLSKSQTVDFTPRDGVRHTAWVISDEDKIKFIETQFSTIPFLYIADGHHRCAAAARVFKSRKGAGTADNFSP